MKKTPILPGLEDAIAKMEEQAIADNEIDKQPTFTAERVANFDPKRYELAVRLLFAENISRRTICKWLHMSPNTLSAIEVRELKLHPELIQELQDEAMAEIEQLKRMGREALRARFFDKKAMEGTSAKEIASILKLLTEMSDTQEPQQSNQANRNTKNDYIDAISSWNEDGFGLGKNSAPEITEGLEVAARENSPHGAKNGQISGENGQISAKNGQISGENGQISGENAEANPNRENDKSQFV